MHRVLLLQPAYNSAHHRRMVVSSAMAAIITLSPPALAAEVISGQPRVVDGDTLEVGAQCHSDPPESALLDSLWS